MNDTINNTVLATFNGNQKFFVNLLCDYYEEKLENRTHEMEELHEQKLVLHLDNMRLKMQVSLIREENQNLTSKLRAANNMIRILTKNMENEDEFATPRKINFNQVDRLLKEKLIVTKKDGKIVRNLEREMVEVTSKVTNKNIGPKNNERKFAQPVNLKKNEAKSFKMTIKTMQENNKENQLRMTFTNEIKNKQNAVATQKTQAPKKVVRNIQHQNKENLINQLQNTQKKTGIKKKTLVANDVKRNNFQPKNAKPRSNEDIIKETYVIYEDTIEGV